MKNPFTEEERAQLAVVLPKLADSLVPDKNPAQRQFLMGQMAAAYVQDYQAPVQEKEMQAGILLTGKDEKAAPIVAQIYANARQELKEAIEKAVTRSKIGYSKLYYRAVHYKGNERN